VPFTITLADAQALYPEYTFISSLTPSEQKAAFHVTDQSGRDLCLKIIAPNFELDRIDREIRALQSISHCNVVALVEYTYSSRIGGPPRHFIVEDYIDGADFSTTLATAPIDSAAAAALFCNICDGLSQVHTNKIVHRDLKPTNIRVRKDGTAVLIDFGLARHLDLPDITLTTDGAAIGTPLYFAPEQFSGTKRDIDSRTDMFAVGVLLYQALVGCHPFYASSMTMPELRDAVCRLTPFSSDTRFLALSRPWQLLIGRMLDKDRGRRPSAAQVSDIIRKISSQEVAR